MRDVYYAAGIYEGEGNCNKTKTGCTVNVGQKDPEILHFLRDRFGGVVKSRPAREFSFHTWEASGSNARGFLMTIFTLLSRRRKEQIKYGLGFRETRPGAPSRKRV